MTIVTGGACGNDKGFGWIAVYCVTTAQTIGAEIVAVRRLIIRSIGPVMTDRINVASGTKIVCISLAEPAIGKIIILIVRVVAEIRDAGKEDIARIRSSYLSDCSLVARIPPNHLNIIFTTMDVMTGDTRLA